jgi:hypothetical protein
MHELIMDLDVVTRSKERIPELSDHESVSDDDDAITPACETDIIDFVPNHNLLEAYVDSADVPAGISNDTISTGSSRTSSVTFSVISEDAEIPWDYKSLVRYTDADFETPRTKKHRRSIRECSKRLVSSASAAPTQRRKISSAHVNTPEDDIERHTQTAPLVLLHCGINLLPVPFSATKMHKLLPAYPELRSRARRLHEKINQNVLDRGILLPHPGSDFGLLQSSLLEHLELEETSKGLCTGYHASEEGDEVEIEPPDLVEGDSEVGNEHSDASDEKTGVCETGSMSSVSSKNNSSWDIRVYAANGLLQRDAWQAAWREMEVVDVEIGVRWPKGVREMLDQQEELLKSVVPERANKVEQAESDELDSCTTSVPHASLSAKCKTRQPESSSKGARECKPLSELLQDYLLRQMRRQSPRSIGCILIIFVVSVQLIIGTSSTSNHSSILPEVVPTSRHDELKSRNFGAGLVIVLPNDKIDALLGILSDSTISDGKDKDNPAIKDQDVARVPAVLEVDMKMTTEDILAVIEHDVSDYGPV